MEYQTHSYILLWSAGCLPLEMQIMQIINLVLRALQIPSNVTKSLMVPVLKGSNASISNTIKHYLYKLRLCIDVFTNCSSEDQQNATMQETFVTN